MFSQKRAIRARIIKQVATEIDRGMHQRPGYYADPDSFKLFSVHPSQFQQQPSALRADLTKFTVSAVTKDWIPSMLKGASVESEKVNYVKLKFGKQYAQLEKLKELPDWEPKLKKAFPEFYKSA